MNSPSSGWTQGALPNASSLLATLTIPVTGTWLISFGIVITSTAVVSGQLTMTNAAFSNIGLTNGTNQATFGAAFSAANTLTFQGSFVVNGISGAVNLSTSYSGGNGVNCLYAFSFFQAVRVA